MSRLTRDGTAEPVSRDQILRHARGQGNVHFPCSADHEQDWQPFPVDPYSAICDNHTYIHTCTPQFGSNRSFFMETYVLEYTMATRNVTIVLGSPIMVVEPQVTIMSFKHNFSS